MESSTKIVATSFIKKNKHKIDLPKPSKVEPNEVKFKTNRVFFSSGIKSLDHYLGGGVTANTMMLIEEPLQESSISHSRQMLHDMLQDSLATHHLVLLAAEKPEELLKQSQGESSAEQPEDRVTSIPLVNWSERTRPGHALGLPNSMESLLQKITPVVKGHKDEIPLKLFLVLPSGNGTFLPRFLWLLRALIKSNPAVLAFVVLPYSFQEKSHSHHHQGALHLFFDYCLVLKPYDMSNQESTGYHGVIAIPRVVRLEVEHPLPDSRALAFKSSLTRGFRVYQFNPTMDTDH